MYYSLVTAPMLESVYHFKKSLGHEVPSDFKVWQKRVLKRREEDDLKQSILTDDSGKVLALLTSTDFMGAPSKVRVINFCASDNSFVTNEIYQKLLEAQGGLSNIRQSILGTSYDDTEVKELELMSELGFIEVARYCRSFLDLANWNERDIVINQKFHIVSFKQAESLTKDFWQKFYNLHEAILHDLPESTHHEPQSLEEFKKVIVDDQIDRGLSFFIKLGDELIALSLLTIADKAEASTYLTGVSKDYQRQGLARALKFHVINNAKNAELRKINTDNESTNISISRLNQELGYQKDFIKIILEKTLS